MGVYIKGMEMPNKQVCVILNPNGLVEILDANNTLLEEYQAVPIPPHGRLIDADALAHELEFDIELDQRVLDQMDFVGKERALIQFDKNCKQILYCMQYLSEASTIIPAEEEES